MWSKTCFVLSVALSAMLVWSASQVRAQQPSQQPAMAFEPLVNRVRDSLKLNEEQVVDLRNVLSKHAPKLVELGNRAQGNPYAPGLQTQVESEQKAIREEFSAYLDEEQKGKLASLDLRPPVPLGPPFVLINIPPRSHSEAAVLN